MQFISCIFSLSGLLRDTTGTFKIPLIVAGCFEILGVLICIPSITIQRREQYLTHKREAKGTAV